jgi:hypothetical protein
LVAWWKAVRGSHEAAATATHHNLNPLAGQPAGSYTFPVEHLVARAVGASEPIDYAERRPSELGFPDSGGEEKALRHLLLAAELHRSHPWVADPLLYGHEYLTNTLTGQPLDVRYKDLSNNAMGKYIGQRSTSREDVERWARAALPASNTTDYGMWGSVTAPPPPDQPPPVGGR